MKIDLTGVRVRSKDEFRDRLRLKRETPATKKARKKFITTLDPSKVELLDRQGVTLRYADREFLKDLGNGSVSRGIRISCDLSRGKLGELSELVLATKAVKYGATR